MTREEDVTVNDLIHKIVNTIIEVGQSDTGKFRLGETIKYSPSEILEILKQHENEIFGEESSTHPNTSNTLNALDTIYRQAAIEAINQICPIDTDYDCTLLDIVDVRCVLTDLPSAQPEVIRCGDCKRHEDEELGMVYRPIIVGGWVRDDWYCADAERRTDE